MNLDDPQSFAAIDPAGILDHIDHLPEQIEAGWQAGLALPLPGMRGPRQVVFTGGGPVSLAASMMAAYAAPLCPAAIHVIPGADLPAHARGADTLVIGLEHEDGGIMAALPPDLPTALSSGFLFAALLAVFQRLELLPDNQDDLHAALDALRSQRESLAAASPLARNPAKRQAGQMMGRWIKIVGGQRMAPAAQSWKMYINLLAKSWAEWEDIDAHERASFAGVLQPDERLPRSMVVFLRARSDPPAERRRLNRARKAFMLDGVGTDTYDSPGPNPLADLLAAIQFGSYTACYLAMCYDLDPAPPQPAVQLRGIDRDA